MSFASTSLKGAMAEQIQEVLLLVTFYCGAANEAHRIASELLAKT